MPFAQPTLSDASDTLPRMPPWVTSARARTLEDVAFLSGAALATLHLVVERADVPHDLLRDRLSLTASEACVRLLGRPERAGDLRDAVHLLRPGDQPGPAGAIYLRWQRSVARPISVGALQRALPSISAEQTATWLDAGQAGPVMRAAVVLETVLATHPREEVMALIVADAVFARSLGWTHVLPLLAVGLKSRDLRKRGTDLQLACHKALVSSIGATLPVVADLTRRAAHLRAVIPKLRAKGAWDAVTLFLSNDALMPAALPLSDRAARRLCDRLVDLGVVRELTGRDTFRLYGV